MSSRTANVIPKGTMRQRYLDIMPGSSSCGLSESCHKVPKSKEPAIRIKGLDALVPGVGNVEDAISIQGKPDRFVKLSWFIAFLAKFGDPFTIRSKDYNTLVPCIADDHPTICIDDHIPGTPETIELLCLAKYPHMVRNSPSGENFWMRWFQVSAT